MNKALIATEEEEDVPEESPNNDLINEIDDALPGMREHIKSETTPKVRKRKKYKSILELLSMNDQDEEFEIDDLGMIGISAPIFK